MSPLLKPFAELPLKLLAIDTIADTKALLQFPAWIPQATFPGPTPPLELPIERPRPRFADTGGWHHGGINE